jgi:hypothetical protein
MNEACKSSHCYVKVAPKAPPKRTHVLDSGEFVISESQNAYCLRYDVEI